MGVERPIAVPPGEGWTLTRTFSAPVSASHLSQGLGFAWAANLMAYSQSSPLCPRVSVLGPEDG